ncbi:MAG: MarR family transcriptional regulator [Cypionkella sp.]|nr:MarR family transcriptional regulator [Cypionkella sp.]
MAGRNSKWSDISQYARPQLSPGFVLWRDFMRWKKGLNAALRPHGLTQPQFAVLAVIGWMTRDDEPVTQQDVVDFLGLDRMHISQIASRLEADGKITRHSAAQDKRAKYLGLTVQGGRLLVQAMPVVEAYDLAFFAAQEKEGGTP